jgi:hypothetical protein
MLDCGVTRLYELLNSNELESYLDGRSRKIVLASIHALIARRLAAATTSSSTPPPELQPCTRFIERKLQETGVAKPGSLPRSKLGNKNASPAATSKSRLWPDRSGAAHTDD